MSGKIYPDLIRVFYTNLRFVDNNLVSYVKGVDMVINDEVWAAVTGLKYAGLIINKENISVVDDFNKIHFYKNCLKNPQARVKNFSVGGLKLNERLLALIVTWILTPRGSNHSILTEEELVYIFCITNKIKVNRVHIIKEHMQKSMRLSDYHYPYAILVSKFLAYFEIDLEEETAELVKSTNEVNNGSLSKMGFTKINGRWIRKGGEQGESSSGMQIDQEDDDQAATASARTSDRHQGDRILSMSLFERFIVNRLDNLGESQRNLQDLCATNFQDIGQRFQSMDSSFLNLDEKIEAVQNQLFELQYGKED